MSMNPLTDDEAMAAEEARLMRTMHKTNRDPVFMTAIQQDHKLNHVETQDKAAPKIEQGFFLELEFQPFIFPQELLYVRTIIPKSFKIFKELNH